MMKRILQILVLILVTTTVPAQEKHSFVGLQSGPSIPLGMYQSKDYPDGAFTLTGISVSMEGAWFFLPWLGAGGHGGIHFHPVDVGMLGYEKVLADPFMNDLYLRSDPYRTYTFYAGLYFHVPLVQRLSFTAKALGGMMYAQSPYQLYKADYEMIGEKWFEITSAGDFTMSFLSGAGLKYDLRNCIGLSLNTEFTYNIAEFEFESLDGSVRTDQKTITFLNILLGVYVKL